MREAAIAVVLVGWAAGAQAQEKTLGRQKVGMVELAAEGNVPDAAREILTQRLVEGLAAAEFEVLGGPGGPSAACRDAACYAALAQSLKVAYLVTAKVQEQKKTYEISLELLNGRTGGVIGSNRERCEICGIEEAAEKMGLAASALRSRLESHVRTPARFIIRSRPAGAEVLIDGKSMGRTPLDATLAGGQHRLTLSAGGYDPMDRSLTVVSGVDETLDYDLVRLPTKFPFKLAGWTAVVAGTLALAAGIWTLAVDSTEVSCSAAQKDPDGHCPRLHDTRVLGASLLGLGAASATLGGVWLYLGSPRGAGAAGGIAFTGRF